MARLIISVFPLKNEIKVREVNGKEILLPKDEFEATLVAGHQYEIKLARGIFTFTDKTYQKVKDSIWALR